MKVISWWPVVIALIIIVLRATWRNGKRILSLFEDSFALAKDAIDSNVCERFS